MSVPSSSTSPCQSLCTLSPSNCQVCGQLAHGKHFGAITCRACAAFFRRAGVSRTVKPCKRENNCIFLKNGWFNCKKCRLQKCWDVGMSVDNFQFDRDTFQPKKAFLLNQKAFSIPQTMDTFLGRSNLILFCAPKSEDSPTAKCYIDAQCLVDKAIDVLLQGSASPFHTQNALGKLALGLEAIRGGSKSDSRSTKLITKIGKEEILFIWQQDVIKVAKWLTYFDPFRKLSLEMQLEFLKNIWKVWTRLENLAVTALGRNLKICDEDMVMVKMENENLICDVKKIEIDITWCSKFTLEQLKFFMEPDADLRTAQLIRMMMALNPSDMELSYMMCQLCFHHVAKKHLGKISEVAEMMQEIISNDLHNYYVNDMNLPFYAKRVAGMMKINNHIQHDIYRGKVKAELAEVFEIFTLEFSHPDMFMEF